jgi:hypothetical protein
MPAMRGVYERFGLMAASPKKMAGKMAHTPSSHAQLIEK